MCGTVDQKQLCMEYSCHVWEVVPCWCWIKTDLRDCWSETCCLFWTLSSSSKCSQLKSFLLTYYFGRCTSELDELVPLPPSHNRSTPHSNRLHDFSVTILRCIRMTLTIISLLAQLDFGFFCSQKVFLCTMI